jgi:glyoxylase-like metal-dependent hydrolase (beta-lactamase superfamily II)
LTEIAEILPGVFHWTAFHPNIRTEVSSYYLEGARALVDPMAPDEGVAWFGERTPPERILLTNRHHYRDSDRFRSEFECPVLCSEPGLHEFEGGPRVESFSFGDEVAPGVTALEVGAICPDETALHVRAGEGLLAVADGVVSYEGLRFVPDQLLGDDPEGVKRGLRSAYAKLLERKFDTILFAHGEPLVGGAREALAAFVESPG